jgi:tetratricopeptide (TPR) repeat protein
MQKLKFRKVLLLTIYVVGCITLPYFTGFSQDFKQKGKGPISTGEQKPTAAAIENMFVEGMKFYIIEEYAKALDIFQKALENDPNNAGLLFQISATYQKLKNSLKAIELAKKAYQLNKNNTQYGQMAASLLAKNGQFEEANVIFKELFEQDKTNSELGLDLAATYFALEKYDEVLKIYNIIEKNLGKTKELSQQKQSLYLKQGKVNDAIKEGEKLIESDPSEIENYIDLAELLIRNDKIDDAKKQIDIALKISPTHGQAHILMADLYRRKSDFSKMLSELNIAVDDKNMDGNMLAKVLVSFLEILPPEADEQQKEKLVQKIIQNNPAEPRGYLLLGDLQMQSNNKKGARDNYLKAVKLDKTTNQIWMRILAIDNEIQAYNDVIEHSEQAIELYPNQAVFWYYNGSANFMLNQFQKSAESLAEAKRLATDEKELLLVINSLLGEAFYKLGQHERSDEAFEEVLKLDPKNDPVANNYSFYLALRKEKLKYASEIAAKLAERNPTNGTYLDTYGWVLYMNKQYDMAKIYLEKAYISNSGKSNVITEHYGDVLYQLGEKDKAIEMWKLASKGSKNINLEKKILEGKIIE